VPGRLATLAVAVGVAAAQGCAYFSSISSLTPEERTEVRRTLRVESGRYLRLSYNVTAFYGDSTRLLLSPHEPEELLLPQPDGEPLSPGPVQMVLPAGRPAKILDLEFPSALAGVVRPWDMPRSQPWVILGVKYEEDEKDKLADEVADKPRPLVLLLRPNLASPEEVEAEVDRYLSKTDVQPLLEGLSEGMKVAIRRKTARLDMPATALEMAWGYPERKEIELGEEEDDRKEIWIYPGALRKAVLVKDRVVSLEPEPR